MKVCKNCGASDSEKTMFEHFKGGYVCNDCVKNFFICPDCGLVFNDNDYEWGQVENGLCRMCSNKHLFAKQASV